MRGSSYILRTTQAACWLAVLTGPVVIGLAQVPTSQTPDSKVVRVLSIEGEGKVEFRPAKESRWFQAYTDLVLSPGDRLRVLERSRATVLLPESSPLRLDELTVLELPPPEKPGFGLLRGIMYFFHRDKPGTWHVQTPTVASLIRGTEFNLKVEEDGTTILSLLDGQVEMTNALGHLTLRSGEQGIAVPGRPLRKTPLLDAVSVIQWCLYYPGVLEPEELEWPAAERGTLQESLSAYGAGDLQAALAKYPAGRQPASEAEKVYLAALVLAVGHVEEAERMLSEVRGQRSGVGGQRAEGRRQLSVGGGQESGVGAQELEAAAGGPRLAAALRKMIAAVKGQAPPVGPGAAAPTLLATEWLAESYYLQSKSDLAGALEAARQATLKSPNFGFAWARLAELEFSFGRVSKARTALAKGLQLSPRNAQALALRGFLLAAQNRIAEAIAAFNEAIAVDGALGNAWLGRGLCAIRLGRVRAGLEDLEVAALLEPQRALHRSYLGKAFSQAGDNAHAGQELELAKRLDKGDPTAWLYSALLNQQRNRINEAIADLEHSQQLNDNRRIYRSRLLLDQDRAVRGANLANVYLDAGLTDVSRWEAARAISADYANFSAHWFLANSYQALRDPRQANLRYETPWLSEYLVANLLAPVGAGTLSPVVTQQEYSKLFERDRLGLASVTEYDSRGAWFEAASQYGQLRNSAYALETAYRSDPGQRRNEDLEQLTLSAKFKQQITPQDGVFLQAVYYDAESGDVAQYYDPYLSFAEGGPNLGLKTKENQEPILLLGYHHEWRPGLHTLFLGGRADDTFRLSNPSQGTLLFDRSLGGDIIDVIPTLFDQEYRSELEIYTAEVQQIWQQDPHTVIVGGRAQTGEFETENTQSNPRYPVPIPLSFSDRQDVSSDFERFTGYGYYYWRVVSPLLLVAGVSYDYIRFPVNYRFAPVTAEEDDKDRFSPKAGFVWTPLDHTTLRAAYARALGGVSFDQSFQLEPSQVAGFNQAFRSLIPESAAGPTTAPTFDTWGVSLEQKFGRGTYVGLSGEWLESDADRTIGVFSYFPPVESASTIEELDYREHSLVLSLYQLLAKEWSIGLRYRLSRAELEEHYVEIPDELNILGFQQHQDLQSTLHQLDLFTLYNHPSGFFAQFDARWWSQSNQGYSPDRPGDDFWQLDAFVGYRFLRRRVEARVGIVNLTDQDYRINPLNLTAELPRERALTARLRFNF